MHKIAILLKIYRSGYQNILIDYGVRLGFVEDVYGEIDHNGNATVAHYALLDPTFSNENLHSKFNGQEALFDEMIGKLTALQLALETALKPLLVANFSELATKQPTLWRELKDLYVLRLHSDVLVNSARGKNHLVGVFLDEGHDPRDRDITTEEQRIALKHEQKCEKSKTRALEEDVAIAGAVLMYTGLTLEKNGSSFTPEDYDAMLQKRALQEKAWLAAKVDWQRELKRLQEWKHNLILDHLNAEITAFWNAQQLPLPDRGSFCSDAKYSSAIEDEKKAYLSANIHQLALDDFPLLRIYFKWRREQHSGLAEFLMAEFVEPKDIDQSTTAGSSCDKTLEDTLLAAQKQSLLPDFHFRLAKLWTVVNEMALNIKLLKNAKKGIFEAYEMLSPETIQDDNTTLYQPFLKTVQTSMIFGLHELTRVHEAPLHLHVEKSNADQADMDYLQDLPESLQAVLRSTPSKIIKEKHAICINYRSNNYFEHKLKSGIDKRQAQFIRSHEQPDYQLQLRLKPDNSGVKSFDLVFDAGNLSTLPKAVKKHIETTGQGLFFRLKQLSNESELKKVVHEYVQTPERLVLLKQALQCFDDSRFIIEEDQFRRVATIAYAALTQRLEKANVMDDASVTENLAVMLLMSRKHVEKTLKWYQPAPNKDKMLALIDKKTPLLQTKSVGNVNELGLRLIENCDLVKRHDDFVKQSFSSDKKLTQKVFGQILVNRINALTDKDVATRLSAEYSFNRLLNDVSTVKIDGVPIVMKEAVRQCVLDNYSQPNNKVAEAFKNLTSTGQQAIVDDLKTVLLEKSTTLPTTVQKHAETTAQSLFFRLKQLSNENELQKLVREYLQTPERVFLLKQALQCFDDSRFIIEEGQSRRVATIAYAALTQRLEKLNVMDDVSVAENLSVMLLTSRKHMEKTAKWYQLVPNKTKMLALIDKKTPLLKAKSVCNVNELNLCLIEDCDLVKRHHDFVKQCFSSDKKLTQKAFEQILVNRIIALADKDVTTRLSAEYSLNRLLKDLSTVEIAGVPIVMKEAVRQCLLDNYSQPNNKVVEAFKNLAFTGQQAIVDELKTLLLEKLKTHIHEGQLTPDGIVLLKNFILMDQQKTLFAELLQHDSEQPYQAILATIRADCFLLDYIKAQTRLKPLASSPKNLLTTKAKVQTLDLKTALHNKVHASLAVFSEAAKAMSASEVDTAIGAVCRRGYWFSSGVRQYEPTDPDVNLCEVHEILTGQNKNSLRLTKLALYLANGEQATKAMPVQDFLALHKMQLNALFQAEPNLNNESGQYLGPLYFPRATVDSSAQKTSVANNVLTHKNHFEWVKSDDNKPILGMTSLLTIQDDGGPLVPKYACSVSFYDLRASYEFLVGMRAAYERAQGDTAFQADAMIDFPELMEQMQQQLNQVLLINSQDPHLKPAKKEEIYHVIDDMLSTIFANKAALRVFLTTQGRSALEKLSDLKKLCGFDSNLAQRFDLRLYSFITHAAQAQREYSADANDLVLTQCLLTPAVKSLVVYQEDPLLAEPIDSESALTALGESSEPVVAESALSTDANDLVLTHCLLTPAVKKLLVYPEDSLNLELSPSHAAWRPADVNHLLPAEPVNSEPALTVSGQAPEPVVTARLLPPWPKLLNVNTRRMSESHCYEKNQPFTTSHIESLQRLVVAKTVMASPIKENTDAQFPPNLHTGGFLQSTGVLATVGHFQPSPKRLRLARVSSVNTLNTP